MEKEEETTRELLLPNWQGSGSHGLTIAQRDDGVYVQEVMQNSPAARTGVVKEGESPRGAGWCQVGWGRVAGGKGRRQLKCAGGCGGPGPSGSRMVGTRALPSPARPVWCALPPASSATLGTSLVLAMPPSPRLYNGCYRTCESVPGPSSQGLCVVSLGPWAVSPASCSFLLRGPDCGCHHLL